MLNFFKVIIITLVFLGNINAQDNKSSKRSNSKQYKSAETGRYVKKTYAKDNPSTTYSTPRKKK